MMAALVASLVLATAALLARSTALAAPPPVTLATARPTAFVAAPPATLVDLRGPSDLRTAFNNDRGHLRIVLLLSPT
jgi:hypothetical protein